MFAALRRGEVYNEGDYGAESTMTAIMGRMATYSGRVITWEDAINSKLNLMPEKFSFEAPPPTAPGPDGRYPFALPGKTAVFTEAEEADIRKNPRQWVYHPRRKA